jgi:hypothetical protein
MRAETPEKDPGNRRGMITVGQFGEETGKDQEKVIGRN